MRIDAGCWLSPDGQSGPALLQLAPAVTRRIVSFKPGAAAK
jgi:hypothetical protein